MKHISIFAVTAATLVILATTAHAGTQDQQALRAQMSSFWGVAEARVMETPPSMTVRETVTKRETRTAPYGYTRACPTTTRTASSAQPTMRAHQQASSTDDSGGFGLTLFGGLRIFDVTWNDHHSQSSDELQGNL